MQVNQRKNRGKREREREREREKRRKKLRGTGRRGETKSITPPYVLTTEVERLIRRGLFHVRKVRLKKYDKYDLNWSPIPPLLIFNVVNFLLLMPFKALIDERQWGHKCMLSRFEMLEDIFFFLKKMF
jgi:hypothetical protein